MKKPFEVGARVRVYGPIRKIVPESAKAEVQMIHEDGKLRIITDCGMHMSAWPQQCRRLRPKKVEKREPRRLWAWCATLEDPHGFSGVTDLKRERPKEFGWVELTETPKSHRLLSREDVERAWGKVFTDLVDLPEFLKALGLQDGGGT